MLSTASSLIKYNGIDVFPSSLPLCFKELMLNTVSVLSEHPVEDLLTVSAKTRYTLSEYIPPNTSIDTHKTHSQLLIGGDIQVTFQYISSNHHSLISNTETIPFSNYLTLPYTHSTPKDYTPKLLVTDLFSHVMDSYHLYHSISLLICVHAH